MVTGENTRNGSPSDNSISNSVEKSRKKVSLPTVTDANAPEITPKAASGTAHNEGDSTPRTLLAVVRDENAPNGSPSDNRISDSGEKVNSKILESPRATEYSEYDQPITKSDVEILRTISAGESGRVSINDFTGEDLEKAQKWAYKFYKELGTKSPFFRAWFGDWRSNSDSPVSVTVVPEYEATNEARKKNRGTFENADTKWAIRVSREGETNTISHSGQSRLSEYGLAGIQSLIENAIWLDTEVHEQHTKSAVDDRIAFDHKFYAIGSSDNGGIALYKITVEDQYANYKNPSDKRFHNLKYIEKIADNIGSLTHSQSRGAESTNNVSTITYSISDLYALVKFQSQIILESPRRAANKEGDTTPRTLHAVVRGEKPPMDHLLPIVYPILWKSQVKKVSLPTPTDEQAPVNTPEATSGTAHNEGNTAPQTLPAVVTGENTRNGSPSDNRISDSSKKVNRKILESPRRTASDYSYEALTAKPDMPVYALTEISDEDLECYISDSHIYKKEMRQITRNENDQKNTDSAVCFHCDDLGQYISFFQAKLCALSREI